MSDSPVFESLYGVDEMDIPVFAPPSPVKNTSAIIHENEYPDEYYAGRMAYFSSNFTNPYHERQLKEYVWWQAGLVDQSKEHHKWKA